MEDLKKQIIKEIDTSKNTVIKMLIFVILSITFMFSATICYITYQTYNYDYEAPSIENKNTNTNY